MNQTKQFVLAHAAVSCPLCVCCQTLPYTPPLACLFLAPTPCFCPRHYLVLQIWYHLFAVNNPARLSWPSHALVVSAHPLPHHVAWVNTSTQHLIWDVPAPPVFSPPHRRISPLTHYFPLLHLTAFHFALNLDTLLTEPTEIDTTFSDDQPVHADVMSEAWRLPIPPYGDGKAKKDDGYESDDNYTDTRIRDRARTEPATIDSDEEFEQVEAWLTEIDEKRRGVDRPKPRASGRSREESPNYVIHNSTDTETSDKVEVPDTPIQREGSDDSSVMREWMNATAVANPPRTPIQLGPSEADRCEWDRMRIVCTPTPPGGISRNDRYMPKKGYNISEYPDEQSNNLNINAERHDFNKSSTSPFKPKHEDADAGKPIMAEQTSNTTTEWMESFPLFEPHRPPPPPPVSRMEPFPAFEPHGPLPQSPVSKTESFSAFDSTVTPPSTTHSRPSILESTPLFEPHRPPPPPPVSRMDPIPPVDPNQPPSQTPTSNSSTTPPPLPLPLATICMRLQEHATFVTMLRNRTTLANQIFLSPYPHNPLKLPIPWTIPAWDQSSLYPDIRAGYLSLEDYIANYLRERLAVLRAEVSTTPSAMRSAAEIADAEAKSEELSRIIVRCKVHDFTLSQDREHEVTPSRVTSSTLIIAPWMASEEKEVRAMVDDMDQALKAAVESKIAIGIFAEEEENVPPIVRVQGRDEERTRAWPDEWKRFERLENLEKKEFPGRFVGSWK
ncbi:unnamed protein product [Periconia digitata]|uniref:Uncharacterized protein n=1 Tax=Periconia digitata TaxID=1303443 RepID=A0A9W4XG37_9PLEO|nr:unnamed protein product [Periconia digitata]